LHRCDAAAPCRKSKLTGRWTVQHWQALVLTIYDTSLRLGCLLSVARSLVDTDRGFLLVPGESMKGRRDELHRLHPQTCGLIAKLAPDALLFPWPKSRRAIWPDFKKIICAAGLPCTYRDLFHRL